jgi:tetratricopeptide (TPR) repeat protein
MKERSIRTNPCRLSSDRAQRSGTFRLRQSAWWLSAVLALPSMTAALAATNPASPVPAMPPTMAVSAAPDGSPVTPAFQNSSLDAPMFYELLLGELEVQSGEAAEGFNVLLDAAKRSQDSAVFQRAVEVAIQGRSGDRALAAVKAWRRTLPDSTEAIRTEVQILAALEQLDELAEPLRELIRRLPVVERPAVIAGVPRFLAGVRDKDKALQCAHDALDSFTQDPNTRTAARTAIGRVAYSAGHKDEALSQVRTSHQEDPASPGPVLLALDLVNDDVPGAEDIVQDYLRNPMALPAMRLAYVQTLEQHQRMNDAVTQLQIALQQQPELSQGWLTLGAYRLELQQPREAQQALNRFFALEAQKAPTTPSSKAASAPSGSDLGTSDSGTADDDTPADAQASLTANSREDDDAERALRRLDYGYILQSQAAEALGDLKSAAKWLDKVPANRMDLGILTRKALLMVHEGHVDAALTAVRTTEVRGPATDRGRLLAEIQVLREADRWSEASQRLKEALQKTPDDVGLVYEAAMTAEHLKRYDEMETLLLQVMQQKPDDAQAYNALGYSLADRGVRLDEAETLIRKALALAPDDPFIVDSLGWVLFREGKDEEALRLLRQSYATRPHAEVATHLGEVLWTQGQKDEALKFLREAQQREPDNDTLRSTLRRLKVNL